MDRREYLRHAGKGAADGGDAAGVGEAGRGGAEAGAVKRQMRMDLIFIPVRRCHAE